MRNFDRKIFVVLRTPQEWARSYYKQSVINPAVRMVGYYACPLTFDEFVQLPRIRQLMQHQALLEDLRRSFGTDALITADYHEDWLQVFSDLTNVPPESWQGFAQVNQSPPDWLIEVLRQVNAFALPEPRRLAWKAMLQAYANTNHVIMKKIHANEAVCSIELESDVLAALVPANHCGFELSPEALADFRAFVQNR